MHLEPINLLKENKKYGLNRIMSVDIHIGKNPSFI